MPSPVRFHRFSAWLALWSVVLAALLPLASQAAAQDPSRAPWIEVCGSSGLIWVRAEAQASDAEQHQAEHPSALTHCVGCLNQAWAFGGAGLAGTVAFLSAARHPVPEHAEPGPFGRWTWHPGQSRAPPGPSAPAAPTAQTT